MLWATLHLICLPLAWSGLRIILDPYFINGEGTHHNLLINSDQKYTEQERNALKQFRGMVSASLKEDYERTDIYLIPWIQSSHMNLRKAKEMLEEAQKWRAAYRMDEILNETVLDIKPTACTLDGLDKDGNPVVLLNSGRGFDVRKWVLLGKGDLLLRYITKCLERTAVKIRYLAKTTGKDITQSTTIMDFEGYNIKLHACLGCVKLYLNFFRLVENYYPNLAKHLVVINVPTIAKPIVEIGKGIMSDNTVKALRIFDTDRSEWMKFLLELIPSAELPEKYGGTRTESHDNENDVFTWLRVLKSSNNSDQAVWRAGKLVAR